MAPDFPIEKVVSSEAGMNFLSFYSSFCFGATNRSLYINIDCYCLLFGKKGALFRPSS